ncbi:YdcF family protein [Arthrobacter sp. UYEF36]|uniref:YdcF family protein n=1 Tax=Arthrobacter sp. UYEF36 TaxID=1756366 RepID=UPI0033914D84
MPPPLPALNAAPRRFRWALAAASGAVMLWLVVAVQLFVNVDPLGVHRTDAVIMLGGAASERLPVAQKLQREHNVPVLVLSHTDTLGNAAADDICNSATFPRPELVCFRPSGMDTRSEAVIIADLADANGWKSVSVVTSSYHVTRAGRLLKQCTTADVQMVASHPALSPGQWLRRFVIETGGLIDASLRPECTDQRTGM